MTQNLPPIYFYIPEADLPEGSVPETADWDWWNQNNVPRFWRGLYLWSLQTYLALKTDGFPCQLTTVFPSEGIVLAHNDSLPPQLRPGRRVLLINIKADYSQHPYAQLQVVQNPQEVSFVRAAHYMPHWPQPNLIPRDPERGDRFETVAYLGAIENLVPELQDPAWAEELQTLGLRWEFRGRPEQWNDYSHVDAVLAIRNFGIKKTYLWKPAAKLYNAWHGKVPAILGYETAYRSERKSELDYLEVTSREAAIQALKRLRDDPELRRAMVANGDVRSAGMKPAQILELWKTFITQVAVPAYEQWRRQPIWSQQRYLAYRYLAYQSQQFQQASRSGNSWSAQVLRRLIKVYQDLKKKLRR